MSFEQYLSEIQEAVQDSFGAFEENSTRYKRAVALKDRFATYGLKNAEIKSRLMIEYDVMLIRVKPDEDTWVDIDLEEDFDQSASFCIMRKHENVAERIETARFFHRKYSVDKQMVLKAVFGLTGNGELITAAVIESGQTWKEIDEDQNDDSGFIERMVECLRQLSTI